MTRVVATKGERERDSGEGGERRRGWEGRGGGGGREGTVAKEAKREREGERSRGLAEEINNGLGNPRSVVHTGGKLPTIPDNGEKEERWSRHRGW